MPLVIDLVDRSTLNHEPPRRLPLLFIPNLLGEYLLERPFRAYFDPLLFAGIIALMTLSIIRVHAIFLFLLFIILMVRLLMVSWRILRRVYDDCALLKHGLIVYGHVIRVRPHRDEAGEVDGAFLDCAIPVKRRRTIVGSVWIPDAAEAERIAQRGSVQAICLSRTPGTWRLLDPNYPAARYESMRENL